MRGSGGVEVVMEVVKRGSGRVGKDVIGRSGTMINGVYVMCRECS